MSQDTREIFKKYNIIPKKSLGQNFLIDENTLQNIAHVIPIKNKNIIEIGPGYGALTTYLSVQNPRLLTLIELDKKMGTILCDRLKLSPTKKDIYFKNSFLTLIHKNVLDLTDEEIQLFLSSSGEKQSVFDGSFTPFKYSVVANIPYYITSPILFHFLSNLLFTPQYMVILMQEEVGNKILEKKGEKRSFLSVSLAILTRSITSVMHVSNTCFFPIPQVSSSVLLFETKSTVLSDKIRHKQKKLLKFLKSGFSHPRKKLIKNLYHSGYELQKLSGIFELFRWDENIRAEKLTPYEWEMLYEKYDTIISTKTSV